jgi:pyruvate/2-oxoglutarate dehydrogenase complex dihydrolipoamide acyltransferase (E2) component
MPEAEENKQDLVDIDTSGPGAEIEIDEPKEKVEVVNETTEEETKPVEATETTDTEEKKEASDEKQDKKEELEDYSEGVKKRIAKLTKKWREAERQKEAALEYAKGVKVEQETLKTKLSTIEPNYVTAMEGRVTSGLQAAQAALTKARDEGNIPAEVEAQKMIARLGVEEARVANLKKQASVKSEEKKETTLDEAIAPKQAKPDPKAEKWAEDNPWFGQDNAMTYTAFDLHKKLTEEEGFDPNTDEYYAEVDKRMRLDFPHKFGNTETKESTKPTQTVASATRSVKPGRQTVRLTSSQVAIAKKLGVPLEEYAKQLKITKEA